MQFGRIGTACCFRPCWEFYCACSACACSANGSVKWWMSCDCPQIVNRFTHGPPAMERPHGWGIHHLAEGRYDDHEEGVQQRYQVSVDAFPFSLKPI